MAREKKIVLLVTTTAPATLVLTFVLTFVHLSRQLKQGLLSSVRHSKDFDIRSASSASGAQACSDIHLAVHCNLAGVQLKKHSEQGLPILWIHSRTCSSVSTLCVPAHPSIHFMSLASGFAAQLFASSRISAISATLLLL